MSNTMSIGSNLVTMGSMHDAGMGAYIKVMRERRGLSQSALALKAGISRAYLSQIESGRVSFGSADIRRRIAAELGIRHADLIVAAGELTADEIAPPLKPTYGDNRLELIAQEWPVLTDKERESLLDILELSRLRRGLSMDDIVRIVGVSERRKVATG